ncbi:MAG TPA: type IV pilus biogenesis protein PilP [Noviherbaspirillum sp.]|nr:type IV pilus biogenesis protein PilP [Noviherbaspirillum sp.]
MQVCLFALSVSTIALRSHAADANSTKESTSGYQGIATFRQLDELRSQNALLAEAVKNAELRHKLEINGGNNSLTGQNPAGAAYGKNSGMTPNGQNPGGNSNGQNLRVPGTATVLLVSSNLNQLSALVATMDGGRVKAKVGTNIPGVGVVQSISANEVIVASGKELISLPFAAEAGSYMAGGR